MAEPARQDLAPRQSAQVVQAPASLMEVISRASTDPNTDVEKLERLVALYERLTEQAAKAEFASAFVEMQPKLPVIDENGAIKNTAGKVQSTYAEWEDINDVIRPILFEHGFGLSFRPGMTDDGKVVTTAILRHQNGQQDEATVTLQQDSSGGKNTVQGVGSSLSYAKRYAAIAVLNITSRAKRDRDDGGRAAGLSELAQRAIVEINMADDLQALRDWKNQKFDGLTKMLSQEELREVVALFNRRLRAAKGEAPANG